MNFESILLDGSVIISQEDDVINVEGATTSQTDSQASTSETTETTQSTAQPEETSSSGSIMPMIGMWVVFGLIFYFLMYRPNKKRETKAKEERDAIGVGDTVITNSGFYGKVVDIGDTYFVLEFGTNKGIKIPVSKFEVIRKTEMPK